MRSSASRRVRPGERGGRRRRGRQGHGRRRADAVPGVARRRRARRHRRRRRHGRRLVPRAGSFARGDVGWGAAAAGAWLIQAGVVRPRPRPPPAGGGADGAAPLEKAAAARLAAAMRGSSWGAARPSRRPLAAAGPSHPVPAVVRPSRPVPAVRPAAVRGRGRPSHLLGAAAAAAAGRRRSASGVSAPARRRPVARAARPPATRSRAWSRGRRRCRPASSTPGASGPGRGLEPSLQFLSSLPRSRRYLSSAVAPLPRRCRGCLRVKPRAPLWAPLVLPRPLFLGKSLLSRLQQGQQKLDKADALRLLSSVLPLAAIRPLLLAP